MYDLYFRVCLGFGGNESYMLSDEIKFDFINFVCYNWRNDG
jgi:hypothetical protein